MDGDLIESKWNYLKNEDGPPSGRDDSRGFSGSDNACYHGDRRRDDLELFGGRSQKCLDLVEFLRDHLTHRSSDDGKTRFVSFAPIKIVPGWPRSPFF